MSGKVCPHCEQPVPQQVAGLVIRNDGAFWRGLKIELSPTQMMFMRAFARTGSVRTTELELLVGGTSYGLIRVHMNKLRERLRGKAHIVNFDKGHESGSGYRLEPVD